eukprot:TRINITY_DN5159_c0_g1_i1.p1 TRINITY_DN5159_c0_g1~~TRINITY_DN5159_c0_g1_i1.p1  ORF type:complete len:630 (+),score=148.94 TRINITY_DN5159_c0_g1_i1:144-2033(+)
METTPTLSESRTIFVEYLPDLKFRQSNQGCLLIIFANGNVFLYSLNENSMGNHPTDAKMLTNEPNLKKLAPKNYYSYGQHASGGVVDSNKYFVYDTRVNLDETIHKITTLNFISDESTRYFRTPKRIMLSPNKKLLLVNGVIHKANSQRCLIVYQIIEESVIPEFRIIFYDLSQTFNDACFSPDSTSLVVIPTKYPYLIFSLGLPIIPSGKSNTSLKKSPSNGSRSSSSKDHHFEEKYGINSDEKHKFINFEARKTGPFSIFGPCFTSFGQPMIMTHITMNCNPIAMESKQNYYQYATWNDSQMGEYMLWKEAEVPDTKQIKMVYYPRFSVPRIVTDKNEEDDGPRNFILDIQFNPKEHKLLMVTRRENYNLRKTDNGIGVQMVNLDYIFVPTSAPYHPSNSATAEQQVEMLKPLTDVYWYQISESDEFPVLQTRWSLTLLLGSSLSASSIVKGKGILELADYHWSSPFQQLYEEFTTNACAFITVDRFHRFWLTFRGELRVMVVLPKTLSVHPEWGDLFALGRTELMNMRHLGSRIGYFIGEVEKDTRTVESLSKKGLKKEPTLECISKVAGSPVETMCGFHLYRCKSCSRPLLKPLQCSRCRSAAYCSKDCQRIDWNGHSLHCVDKK